MLIPIADGELRFKKEVAPPPVETVSRVAAALPEPDYHEVANGSGVVPEPETIESFGKLLTKPQIIAAIAIAHGDTATKAARKAGVKVGTVRQWRNTDIAFNSLRQSIIGQFLTESRTEASLIMLRKLRKFKRGKGDLGDSVFEWVRLALYMTSTRMSPNTKFPGPTAEQLHQHVHVHGGLPTIPQGIDGNPMIGTPMLDGPSLLNLQSEARQLTGDERRGIADLLRPKLKSIPATIASQEAEPDAPIEPAPTQSAAPKEKKKRRHQHLEMP